MRKIKQKAKEDLLLTSVTIVQKDYVQYKVLLVEDDALAQLVAKHQLEQLNCIVEIANNGEEALFLTKKNNYDLILFSFKKFAYGNIFMGSSNKWIVFYSIYTSWWTI